MLRYRFDLLTRVRRLEHNNAAKHDCLAFFCLAMKFEPIPLLVYMQMI